MSIIKRVVFCCVISSLSFSALAGKDSLDTQPGIGISLASARPDDDPAGVARERPYKLNLPVDAAITIPATIWSIYAFPKIYSKPNIDSVTVATLNKENIPKFDRWAVRHSDKADEQSNILFYASMPYPFVLLLDKEIRKDAATVGALYWEAMAITGLLYTGGDYFIDRYRPETYDESKPFGERQSGNEKNSFFAGHVALVSTSTFFTASIYDEYHPTSKFKWVLYGAAVAATGTTIYLRHVAGKHFPSDLLVGTIIGVGSGMLVPRLHRNKAAQKHPLTIVPTVGNGYGVAAVYRF